MSGVNRASFPQTQFLMAGGAYAGILADKRDKGEIDTDYVFREYPKMLRMVRGRETVHCQTETVKGKTLEWDEERDIIEDIVVYTEDEEDRVLSGGKTAAQIEDERQDLLTRARSKGLHPDPKWTTLRLRRALGEADDEPPKDEIGALKARMAQLQELSELRKKVRAMESHLSDPVNEPEPESLEVAELNAELRAEDGEVEKLREILKAKGRYVDSRWGIDKLRAQVALANPSA